MPRFNRRGFLQLASAAGVAPLLPALPSAVAAKAVGSSHAKALWAGIHAKSGSAAKFGTVARNMGLSNAAIQGVSAKSICVRVVIASTTNPVMPKIGVQRAALVKRSVPKVQRSDALQRVRDTAEKAIRFNAQDGALDPEDETETVKASEAKTRQE